jgi:hypothetical protein
METETIIETEKGPDGVYRPKRINRKEKREGKRALENKAAAPDPISQLSKILDGIERGIKIYAKISKKMR